MKIILRQLFLFGLTGVICFFIDYGIMVLLTTFGVYYLVSSAISFTVSVTVNYILSIRFVFKGGGNKHKKTLFIVFVLLSVLGLGLNQAIMALCVETLFIFYTWSKVISTIVVMVYNFITRKLIIEKKHDRRSG